MAIKSSPLTRLGRLNKEILHPREVINRNVQLLNSTLGLSQIVANCGLVETVGFTIIYAFIRKTLMKKPPHFNEWDGFFFKNRVRSFRLTD